MKKLVAVLLMVVGLSHAADSEFGIGAIFDNGQGASLAIKYNEWKFDIDGGSVAIDNLVLTGNLTGSIDYFIGLGGYTSYTFNSIGARLPIGIDIDIASNIDIFIEWIPGVSIAPTLGNFGTTGFDGGIRIFF